MAKELTYLGKLNSIVVSTILPDGKPYVIAHIEDRDDDKIIPITFLANKATKILKIPLGSDVIIHCNVSTKTVGTILFAYLKCWKVE